MSTKMSCPHCKVELQTMTTNGALSCSQCGGGFCSREALVKLLSQVEISPPAGVYARASLSLSGPVRYIACPVCSELMLRRNFGETSGVVIDVCTPHGVWFDRGELGKILEFCASGELAKAEAGAHERRQARQQLDGFGRRLDAAGPSHDVSAGRVSISQDSLEHLCLELAGMLRL
ncbi:MAG TPA: zf-TFIIB domain-containing protein [Polyangiaceae bacterium]|nr:zf-TFIIB domain-containing protein [Polyangiaceae bacterium]